MLVIIKMLPPVLIKMPRPKIDQLTCSERFPGRVESITYRPARRYSPSCIDLLYSYCLLTLRLLENAKEIELPPNVLINS